ncbi:MAG: hypothetical protein NC911_09220, partial [Candidatus Omnitrophica bacterium]|nr:hypothetical protein [Candidatus Omnitrophota bacterium]
EENNLQYALDRLFDLRKTLKSMIQVNKNVGLNGVKTFVLEIMELRNKLLLAPCPQPENFLLCEEYRTAVQKLSGQVDELALCLSRNQPEKISLIVNGLLELVNLAYSLAL